MKVISLPMLDIVPTILYINHINGYENMDGRVMTELLSGNRMLPKPITSVVSTETSVNNLHYKLSSQNYCWKECIC